MSIGNVESTRYEQAFLEGRFLRFLEMREYFHRELCYLMGMIKPEHTVLDVGCGAGRTMAVTAQVAHTTGVDYNPRMIAAARQNIGAWPTVDLVEADILEWKWSPDRLFDLVFASFSLIGLYEEFGELTQKQNLIRAMGKYVKPGGRLVFSYWKPCTKDWLESYYSCMGAELLDVIDDVAHTTMGRFERFTRERMEALVGKIVGAENYGIATLDEMWDLVIVEC